MFVAPLWLALSALASVGGPGLAGQALAASRPPRASVASAALLGPQTKKSVWPPTATGGETLFYTLDVTNHGSSPATGVVLRDSIPAGTSYIPGSTRVDGAPVADVGGTSPLQLGLALGTLPDAGSGDPSRQVTFQVRVGSAACSAGQVDNSATVEADGLSPVPLGPASVDVIAAVLEPPALSVSPLSGPLAGPGSIVSYLMTVANDGEVDLGGVVAADSLPAELELLSAFATSGAVQLSGNDVTLADASVSAGGSLELYVLARVRSVAELAALGIGAEAIDGRVVSTQGTVTAGCGPAQLTDDPATAGFGPTDLVLAYRADVSGSDKTAQDVDGGYLDPGDRVRFVVTVRNDGNRSGGVSLTDGVPAGTQYVAGSTRQDGVPVADAGGGSPLVAGLSLGTLAAGAEVVVEFQVDVDALAGDGALIVNTAHLEVFGRPDLAVDVSSPALSVFAAPELSASTKSVVDLGGGAGYAPGDEVEYTLRVTNSGNRTATGITVTDSLPAALSFVSASAGGVAVGQDVTWGIPSLLPGGATDLLLRARLATPLDKGTLVANTATLDAAELPPFTTAAASFTVTASPVLVVSMVDEHATLPPRPGELVTYRISVANTGDMEARFVAVDDVLDAAKLTEVQSPNGQVSGASVHFDVATEPGLGSLMPGDPPVELVIEARLATPLIDGSVVDNQATASVASFPPVLSDDPDRPGASNPTRFLVTSQASLAVSKRVVDLSPSTEFLPGDWVRYDLELTGGGDAPTRLISLTDAVPAGLIDADASATGGSVAGGVVSFGPGGQLAWVVPGQVLVRSFVARIDPGATDGTLISNQASAQSVDLPGPVASDGDAVLAGAQPTTFVVASKPSLRVEKSVQLFGDDDPEPNPGDHLRYTVSVANDGIATASDVVVSDALPPELALTDGGGGTLAGSTLTWDAAAVPALAALGPGQSLSLSFTARLARPLDDGTVVANRAQAVCAEAPGPVLSDDPATVAPADATAVTVVARPAMLARKTVADQTGDPLSTRPLDLLTYTLSVENRGDTHADEVEVRDPIPAGLDVTVPSNARLEGGELVWDALSEPALLALDADATLDLVFSATVAAGVGGGAVIDNQAAVAWQGGGAPLLSDDPRTTLFGDPTRVVVFSATDLGATSKVVTNLAGAPLAVGVPGEVVRFVITVDNRGEASATAVVVQDSLDPRFSIVAAPGAQVSGQTVTWSAAGVPGLASVGPGQSVPLSVDVRLAPSLVDGLVLENQAQVSAAELASPIVTDADPLTAPREVTTLVVDSAPQLVAEKQFLDAGGLVMATARPGDAVVARITVSNTGTAPASALLIEDDLDLTRLSGVTAQDGGNLAGSTASWSLAALEGGESRSFSVSATVTVPQDSGVIVNQALVRADGLPDLLSDDPALPGLADATELVIDSAALLAAFTKDVSGDQAREVSPGQALTYQLAFTHEGTAVARQVVVQDVLPALVDFTGATGGASYDAPSRTVRWDLGDIAPGAAPSLAVQVTVSPSAPDGTRLDNQAVLSALGLADALSDDPEVPQPDSVTSVVVTVAPRLTLQKRVELLPPFVAGMVRPGDRLRYTLVVENQGNAPATDVVIDDPLDPALTDLVLAGARLEGAGAVADAATLPELAVLAPGASVQLTIEATLAAGLADGRVVANQASAGCAERPAVLSDDPDLPGDLEPTVLELRYPSLVLEKQALDVNGGLLLPGDALRFDLRLRNSGSVAASALAVSDALDPRLELSLAPGASFDGTTLTWTLPDLLPGEEVALTADVVLSATTALGATIDNQATAALDAMPAVPSDWPLTPAPLDAVRLVVAGAPELALTKALVLPGPDVVPGDVLTYRLTLCNAGPVAATGVSVTDELPPELDFLAARGDHQVSGRLVTFSADSLDLEAAAGCLELEIDARVAAGVADGAVIANRAYATAQGVPQAVASEDAGAGGPTLATVSARVRLDASTLRLIDDDAGTAQPGDALTLVLQVDNPGTMDAAGVNARLGLPALTTYVPGSTQQNGQPMADVDGASPLFVGMAVRSPGAAEDGAVLRSVNGASRGAVITLGLRVDPRAVAGTTLSAQASIAALGQDPVLSDNPATPGLIGDPTVVVVGGGPTLSAQKRATLIIDAGGDGRADVGDVLRYRIDVANAGDAPAVAARLEDPLPPELSAVPGSLNLDGASLSEAEDADAAELLAGLVGVRLGDLAPGAARAVTLDARVLAGPVVRNQASFVSAGRDWRSDGDPTLPGEQPTVTLVDPAATVLELALSAEDTDGGVLDPGDTVRLVLDVKNGGGLPLADLVALIETPAPLVEVAAASPDGAALRAGTPATWDVTGLGEADVIRLEYLARVAEDAASGLAFEIGGAVTAGPEETRAQPVRLLVGGTGQTALVRGRVFRELGPRDGAFGDGDAALEGYVVTLVADGGESPARALEAGETVRTTRADRQGNYSIANVPPGTWRLRIESETGTQFAESAPFTLRGGDSLAQDFPVDPSGVVYQAVGDEAAAVPGARLFLYDLATGDDVAAADLGAGQQGQITAADGFYRFDLAASRLPGTFGIRVEPPGPSLVFPSGLLLPVGGTEDLPLGTPAPSTGGPVVANDFPDVEGDTTYFLAFAIDPTTVDITNNHIPLDRLAQRLRITKVASRRTAQVGDVLTYTVTITNPTAQNIDAGDALILQDDLPEGLRWVEGSAVLTQILGGRASAPISVSARRSEQAPRTVSFGPLRLPAETTFRLRYYAAVGLRAEGEQKNRARLWLDGAAASNESVAAVRITPDPLFVEGTLLGRVFCDADGDGELSEGEDGLPGARVFLDTGFHVDTDAEGKYHFRGILPGRHLVKLDDNSLPPQSRMVSSLRRDFLVTPGVLSKIDFAVACGLDAVHARVPLGEAGSGVPTALVAVERELPAISLDATPQPLPLVDGVLLPVGVSPDFAGAAPLVVRGAPELVWHFQASRVRVRRWEISIFQAPASDAEQAKEVWRLSGQGAPPDRLPWNLGEGKHPFSRDGRYLYRLAVLTTAGDLGEGRWRELFYEPSGAGGKGESLAFWRGALFEGSSPVPELVTKAEELAGQLRERGYPPIVLEVHLAEDQRRTQNLIMSQRQAVALKKLLAKAGVPEDKVSAIGKGDTVPLMANVTRRARELNRRIIVYTKTTAASGEQVPLSYVGWLRIDGYAIPGDEAILDAEIEVREGRPVVVDLLQPNGRRVRVERAYPFTDVSLSEGRRAQVSLGGTLSEAKMRVGGVPVELPLLRSACGLAGEPPGVGSEGLKGPVRFAVASPAPVAHWTVRVTNPNGSVLTEISEDGAPPGLVEWEGKNAQGTSIVRAGTYGFRCLLRDAAGNRWVSAQKTLVIGGSGAEGEVLFDKTLAGEDYPDMTALSAIATAELDKAAAALTSRPGARLAVEVHDVADGGKMQAQVRTSRLAGELKASFVARGFAESSLSIRAFGASKIVLPGDSLRARNTNRRVVIQVLGPPPEAATAEAPPPPARLKVAGQTFVFEEGGVFGGEVIVASDTTLIVDLVTPAGDAAIYTVPLFDGRPRGAAKDALPYAGPPEAGMRRLGSDPRVLLPGAPPPSEPVLAAVEPSPTVDAVGGLSAGDAKGSGPWAQQFQPSGPAPLHQPTGPPPLHGASGPAPLVPPSGPAPLEMASGPAPRHPPSGPPGEWGDAALVAVSLSQLVVYLPPDGATLRGERLTVHGRAGRDEVVRINGELVATEERGRFTKTLVLPPGEVEITVTAESPEAQPAKVVRRYRVPDSEWFVMALGDTAAGVGPPPPGANDDTLVDLPADLYLHGRFVGYLKGRIKGSALIDGMPFEDVRLTAHVDSGKQEDPALLKQLIDPERYYPVYGDGTEEVQDVSSREKLYVLVQADESRAIVGNFDAKLLGLELFRYERSFFGAGVDLDHKLVAGQRTEVHAFAASGSTGIRARRLALLGTGGSLYFLRDENILEGSERVSLVVRDAVTGGRLITLPQTRDADYRIDYRDGRLSFNEPVPGAVPVGWRVNQNPVRGLEGHPVYLEVSYDYDAGLGGEGEQAFGAQVRQTFNDALTLGAGVVSEDRSAQGAGIYQLVGGQAGLTLSDKTRLDAEVAWSRARDAQHWVSLDGGVTYGQLDAAERFFDEEAGRQRRASGWAGKLQLAGDLSEVLGDTAARPYTLYVQHQDPGFFSSAGVFEQGQSKAGAQLRLPLTEADFLRLRHDASWTRLQLGGEGADEHRVMRQVSAVGFEHAERDWKAGAELGNTYVADQVVRGAGPASDSVDTVVLAIFGEKELTPRLVGFGEQEVVGLGDERVVSSLLDRFATTAGARYQLDEALWANAQATARWSGQHSLAAGLQMKLDDDLSAYARERLTAGDGRPVSTTIVGAESRAVPGSRSYAEYQLDALASGKSGRAVFGMDNHWDVADLLRLHLSYERSQLVGTPAGVLTQPTGYAVTDPTVTGYGSGVLNQQAQFSAASYASAGTFPVGVASRDAFAFGFDLLGFPTLKAGARLELRYDRADDRLLGADRFVLYGMAGGDWRFERDFVLLLRGQAASVENVDFDFTEGQFGDLSLGLAFRPAKSDRVAALAKWTRRYERRALTEDRTLYQLSVSDVMALEPAFELGLRLQLVGKLALKLQDVVDAQLPRTRSTTVLSLLRLNFHLTDAFDAGLEYRWLTNMLVEQTEHGALVELAWLPSPLVAVGLGYNFTRFSDDLLAAPDDDQHGVFLRVTGRY